MLRKIFFPRAAPASRGHDIKRIETFSDGVFAFAVTLLIVSLEVPKSFEELLISMRGFVAFAACFTFLLVVWYEQHTFFRAYGVEDTRTIVLNSALLFIILFYVYPLKFVCSLMFSDEIYGAGKSPFSIKDNQVPELMMIYGLGYIALYTIFLLLYLHVLRLRRVLRLTPLELFDTRTRIYAKVILIAVGCCSILLVLVLPARSGGIGGFFYMVIGPAFWIYYGRRARIKIRLHSDGQVRRTVPS